MQRADLILAEEIAISLTRKEIEAAILTLLDVPDEFTFAERLNIQTKKTEELELLMRRMNNENIELQLQLESFRREKDELKAILENQNQGQPCSICLTQPSELALVPCGHKCCCRSCEEAIEGVCPLCREPVCGTLRIF
jgi:hypothetical protein